MASDRSEATRRQIIETATRLFAQHGYDKTSTAFIAKQAGLSQGIIFHYFSTKEDLFLAIIGQSISRLHQDLLAAITPDQSPADKLIIYLKVLGQLSLEDTSRSEIFTRQIISMSLNTQTMQNFGVMGILKMLIDIFEEGKRMAIFKDFDTHTASRAVLGLFLGNFIGWLALGKNFDLVHALQQSGEMFLNGILMKSN
jgi:AcrR family transcriptional regulator